MSRMCNFKRRSLTAFRVGKAIHMKGWGLLQVLDHPLLASPSLWVPCLLLAKDHVPVHCFCTPVCAPWPPKRFLYTGSRALDTPIELVLAFQKPQVVADQTFSVASWSPCVNFLSPLFEYTHLSGHSPPRTLRSPATINSLLSMFF